MDEVTQKVEEIVANAPKWSFQHDMSILDLMKMVSKNLESRATNAGETLKQLDYEVEKTAIGLDNTANSLTALQFGQQFVESRCLDDDDETVTFNKEIPEEDKFDSMSSEEILQIVLKNSLDAVHKCHEKYAINIEDSEDDDDDAAGDNSYTYIYQAKNPYNERLLPHIYGSKLWEEQWHVGLADETENSYSDEEKDVYSTSSESNISAANPNESLASSTSHLSDWPSSISLSQPTILNTKESQPITIQNVIDPTLLSNKDSPGTSKTSGESYESKNAKHINQSQPRHFDLFADIRTTPPETPTNSNISQKYSNPSLQSSSNSINKYAPTVPPIDFLIDARPKEETENPYSDTQNSDKLLNKGLLRKPVNLFDDDDFNNFMSEINNKVQNKSPEEAVEKDIRQKPLEDVINPSIAKLENRSLPTDLFAENSEDTFIKEKPKSAPRSTKVNIEKPNNKANLDTPELEATISHNSDFNAPSSSKISKFSAKSLFDDEDDDDFLNVFAKKSNESKTPLQRKLNLFDDLEEEEVKIETPPKKEGNITNKSVNDFTQPSKTFTKSSLFDSDDEDDFLSSSLNKTKKTVPPTDESLTNSLPISSTKILNKTSKIFDDIDSDNDDIFATTSKTISFTAKASENLKDDPNSSLFAENKKKDLLGIATKSISVEKPSSNEPSEAVKNQETKTPQIQNIEDNKKNEISDVSKKPVLFEEDDDLDFLSPSISKNTTFKTNKGNNSLGTFEDNNFVHTEAVSAKDRADISTTKELQKSSIETITHKYEEKLPEKSSLETKPLFEYSNDDDDDEHEIFFGPSEKLLERTFDKNDKPIKKAEGITEELSSNLANTKIESISKEPINSKPSDKIVESKSELPKRNLFSDSEDEDFFTSKTVSINKQSSKSSNELKPESSVSKPSRAILIDNQGDNLFSNAKEISKTDDLSDVPESFKDIQNKKPSEINNDQQEVQEFTESSEKEANLNEKNILADVNNENNDDLNTVEVSAKAFSISESPSEKSSPKVNEDFEPIPSSKDDLVPSSSKEISSSHSFKDVSDPPSPEAENKLEDSKDITKPPETVSSSFAGLFLDEPPDDNDFLSIRDSNQQSSSRIFDDFYDSNLNSNSNNNKLDSSDITDYKSIRLFDDLPPDDEFETLSDQKESLESSSKRLHSIFYDDFNETKEAIKNENKPMIPSQHAFFNDEPPSDEDLWSLKSDKTKKLEKTKEKGKEEEQTDPTKIEKDSVHQEKLKEMSPKTFGTTSKLTPPTLSKEISPDLSPVSVATSPLQHSFTETESNKEDSLLQKQTNSSLEYDSKSNVEVLKAKLQEIPKVNKELNKGSNVSKLKLPKMDINVKALIPAGPGKPAFKKSPLSPSTDLEDPVETNQAKQTPIPDETFKTPKLNSSLDQTKESFNENILTNLCKNRVRPPATRKPSSRSGRKENYLKSLQVQEEEERKFHENNSKNDSGLKKSSRKTINSSVIDSSPYPKTPDDLPVHKVLSERNKSPIEEVSSSKNKIEPQKLFPASSDDDLEDLFDRKPIQNKKVSKKSDKSEKDKNVSNKTFMDTETSKKPPMNKNIENLEDNTSNQILPSNKSFFDTFNDNSPLVTDNISKSNFLEQDNLSVTGNNSSKSVKDHTSLNSTIILPNKNNSDKIEKNKNQTVPAKSVKKMDHSKAKDEELATDNREKDSQNSKNIADLNKNISVPEIPSNSRPPYNKMETNQKESSSKLTNKKIIHSVPPKDNDAISKPFLVNESRRLKGGTSKVASKSLFSESSTESDDDLFKTAKTSSNKSSKVGSISSKNPPEIKQPVESSKKPTVSLFASDSDDDDPFEKSFKSKTLSKKTITDKPSKGLFSDVGSDDDDDLFGGAPAKKASQSLSATSSQRNATLSRPAATTLTKTPLTTQKLTSKETKTLTTTTIANEDIKDNPLADLL